MKKKIFSIVTAAVMLIPYGGCGTKKEGASLDVRLETAYISEEMNYRTSSLIPSITVDNGILLSSQNTSSQRFRLYHWNMNTDEATEVELHNKDKKHGFGIPVSLPDGKFGVVFQQANPYYNVSGWDLDVPAYMDIYTDELQYVETKEIPEMDSYSYQFCCAVENDKPYLICNATSDDGTDYLNILDMDTMEVTGSVGGGELEGSNYGLVQGADYQVYRYDYSLSANDANYITKVNIAEQKFDSITISGDFTAVFSQQPLTGTCGYALYVFDKTSLYGLKLEGNTGTFEEVMNMSSSDFVDMDYVEIGSSPDGRFIVYDSSLKSSQLWVCRKRTDEELANCKLITLAGVDIPHDLKQTVVRYNRSHSDYHIAMVDYIDQFVTGVSNYTYTTIGPFNGFLARDNSRYYASELGEGEDEQADAISQAVQEGEDEQADAISQAVQLFEQDLFDGIVPDIICTDNIPYARFANKGLFLDMSELMEKDERFHADDYVMNFFDSMKYKGQQQTIAFSFYINTIAGETEYFGDKMGLTADEFIGMIENAKQDDFLPFWMFQEDYTDLFLAMNLQSSFLNTEEATCNFDSQAFTDLLQYGTTLYKSTDSWETYLTQEEEHTLKAFAFTQPVNYHELTAGEYLNAGVTLIGYPVGGNGGIFSAPYSVAINSQSENQDEIWNIFMDMLSEENQRALDVAQRSYSFPVLRSALEEDMDSACKGDRIYNVTQYIGAMTQEERDFLMRYIEGITAFYYCDPNIADIISEEAEMCYAGDQTAEQAAEKIQSRASLYLSEQY